MAAPHRWRRRLAALALLSGVLAVLFVGTGCAGVLRAGRLVRDALRPAAELEEYVEEESREVAGVPVSLHRPRGVAGPLPAVVLCHGLSSNHRGLHFPGRSLAGWLAAHGYDVYLPDLRGSGDSDRPEAWDLDDHVYRDIPAILGAVRRASGRDRVHWVGHSMGGVVLFCHGVAHPDAPIASGITIAASLDYTEGESGYRNLLPIRHLLEKHPPRAIGWLSGDDPYAFDNRNIRLLPGNARSELGCPSFGPIFALGAAVEYLEQVGVEAIAERVLTLNMYLTTRLARESFEVLSPGGPHRSGQTLVRVPQPQAAHQFLRERGVQVTLKPEGLRVSTHFYNDEAEIDACVAALVEHREQNLA